MRPAPFDYLRPRSVEEALDALARNGDEAAIIAGGQSLVPMLAMRLARPSVVVDIAGLQALDGIEKLGGSVHLGALVRHRRLERDATVARALPLLSEAAGWVATPAIRNAGTIGGALCLGDPAAEYPAVALALDARLRLASVRGERVVAARDFFVAGMETAAAPDELLLGVEVPAAQPGDAFGFAEIAERRGDYALAGAALARCPAERGGVRVALFGAAEATVLAHGAAAILGAAEPAAWDARLMEEVKAQVARDLGDTALDPMRARLAGVAVVRAARRMAGSGPRDRQAA